MKKMTNLSRTLLAFTVLTGGLALAGCSTDDGIDLSDIDTHIGIGSDGFTLPSSSTNNIKLGDILDLKEGDCIEILENGDYQFRKSDELNAANPEIEQVAMTLENPTDFPLENIPIVPGTSYSVPDNGPMPLKEFTFKGDKGDDIIDITSANLNGNATLKLGLSALKNYMGSVNMDVYIPKFLEFDNGGHAVEAPEGQDYKILKLTNLSTNSDLTYVIPLKKLNKYEGTNTYAKIDGGNIAMKGEILVQLHLSPNATATPTVVTLPNNNVEFSNQIMVTHAEGIFNPTIDPQTSTVDISTGIPDFLKDDAVKIMLDNPAIAVSITNNTNVRGIIEGIMTAYYEDGSTKVMKLTKDQLGNKILLNEHTGDVSTSTDSKIVICRKPGSETGVQYIVKDGTAALETGETENNIANILTKIPQKLDFTFNTRCDTSYPGKIDLCDKQSGSTYGRSYYIQPKYDFTAALAMDAGSTIVYNDTIDDWNKDLTDSDVDLLQGTELTMTATVTNGTPMKLYIEPVAIGLPDASGNVSTLPNIEVTVTTDNQDANGYYIPSNYGTSGTSTLRVLLKSKETGAFKLLDGLLLHVKAITAQDGITLNSRTQTIKLDDMKIQLTGKVIIDVDK